MGIRRRAAVATALIAAAALALTGCSSGSGGGTGGPSQDAGSSATETLTLGSIMDINSFDPTQAHLGHPSQYFQAVYDSLIRRKPDNTFVPMLATKWSYNEDKTVLTLTIRKGVTFSDGTKLDADAVKENLDRFRKGNGPDAATLSYVSDVSAPDATTVKITLSAPDPSLIYSLSNTASFVASPKAIDGGKIATKPVGSGPYVLDGAASVAGSKYVFTKRKGYWDPKLQKYAKLVIKPISDNTAMLNALISGQLDAGLVTSPKDAERAKSSGLTEHDYPTDWAGMMIFDRDGAQVPALKSVQVRQAMNYAINKKAILKQVQQGKGTVTSQILPPKVPGYQKSLDHAYPYNPKKAKKLMAEAGYKDGFAITLPTVSGLADPAETAAIQQNLKDIGIKVTWKNVAGSDFISKVTQGKFPVVSFQEAQGTAWYTAGIELTPDAVYNPLGTKDATVEKYVKQLQTGSAAEQKQAAVSLNKYIVEQAWFVPFFRPSQLYFSDQKTRVQPQLRQAVPSIYNYAPKN